ncbi:MAG TPA: PAS domain-containing protein [Gaiellaceae bacterium]|nr:PAS domain-containing protein [Gaiellaceae bacterium]
MTNPETVGAVYATDELGCITYVSGAIEGILGYVPSDLLGRRMVLVTSDEERDVVEVQCAKLGPPAQRLLLEVEARRRDGRAIPLRIYCETLREAGRVVGVVGMVSHAAHDESYDVIGLQPDAAA